MQSTQLLLNLRPHCSKGDVLDHKIINYYQPALLSQEVTVTLRDHY